MSVTSIDGALAGMKAPWFFFKGSTAAATVGRPVSFWPTIGVPGAGSFDTTINGVVLSSSSTLSSNVAGQLPFVDPTAGSNTYLARFVASLFGAGGKLGLADRIWHNGNIAASTGAQTIASPTWPARDVNGTTNGVGILVGLEYNTTGANNTPAPVTLNYTNAAGTASRSANPIVAIVANSAANSFYPFGLQAGDTGVRSVQGITFAGGAPTAGSCNLVAYRIIAELDILTAGAAMSVDLLTGGMPQMFNGTVPFLIALPNVAAALYATGQYVYTQG